MHWTGTGVAATTVREDSPVGTDLGGLAVVLVRVGDRIHALAGECPHRGAMLSEGTLGPGRLVCPLHEAAFDPATGRVLADPFAIDPPEGGVGPATSFPVEIRDGEVWIGAP